MPFEPDAVCRDVRCAGRCGLAFTGASDHQKWSPYPYGSPSVMEMLALIVEAGSHWPPDEYLVATIRRGLGLGPL